MPPKGFKHSEESKKKMSISKLLNPTRYWLGKKRNDIGIVFSKANTGRIVTESTRKKLSLAKGGVKHWNWQGGKTSKNRKLRHSRDFKIWRELVFKRDNWTCVECGKRGVTLHPHHIKELSKYFELALAVENGITLCLECHSKKHYNKFHAKNKQGPVNIQVAKTRNKIKATPLAGIRFRRD